MHAEHLQWSGDIAAPLTEHLRFVDPAANTIAVGTGRFSAGQVMPSIGHSQYPMREISFVLEGSIRTESGGKVVILKAGDLVTIPPDQKQVSHVLEDTKLISIFFGRRPVGETEG